MLRVVLGLLIGILTLSAACDEFRDWEPDEVNPDEIIQLKRLGSDEPLVADGKDQARLVALLPSEASARVVTFTSSAGTFLTTTQKPEFSIRAVARDGFSEDSLVAEAVLVAGTTDATAYVFARVGEGAFSDSLVISIETPSPNSPTSSTENE